MSSFFNINKMKKEKRKIKKIYLINSGSLKDILLFTFCIHLQHFMVTIIICSENKTKLSILSNIYIETTCL